MSISIAEQRFYDWFEDKKTIDQISNETGTSRRGVIDSIRSGARMVLHKCGERAWVGVSTTLRDIKGKEKETYERAILYMNSSSRKDFKAQQEKVRQAQFKLESEMAILFNIMYNNMTEK